MPEMIPMYPVRRGAVLIDARLDEEGRPAVTFACDCSVVTVLVLEVDGAANGSHELAFTCAGCLSSHWVTFTLRGEVPRG